MISPVTSATKVPIGISRKHRSPHFEELSIEVLAFTGSMLSLRKKCKINIYNSGKIIVITKDLNQVHEIAKELENVIDIGKK